MTLAYQPTLTFRTSHCTRRCRPPRDTIRVGRPSASSDGRSATPSSTCWPTASPTSCSRSACSRVTALRCCCRTVHRWWSALCRVRAGASAGRRWSQRRGLPLVALRQGSGGAAATASVAAGHRHQHQGLLPYAPEAAVFAHPRAPRRSSRQPARRRSDLLADAAVITRAVERPEHRGQGRRSRAAAVHGRHDRCGQGRHAHPSQPGGQHPSGTCLFRQPGQPERSGHRHGRAAALPHLRHDHGDDLP